MDRHLASSRLPTETPLLQLHLEPERPLEVRELTNALGSLSRRYQSYIEQHGVFGRGADARLLVWNVSPGSIDIALIPDPATIGGLLGPAYEVAKHLVEFGTSLKEFLQLFKKDSDHAGQPVSVQGCDDATNIVAPIANNGGVQHINVLSGDIINPIIVIGVDEAREIVGEAQRLKSAAQRPATERHQRVALVWKRLDRGKARTASADSPDRAIVEEIDDKDHPAFFTDEAAYLKGQMIGDDENPYRMVYFVDIDVSRHRERVVSYRITAYYGKEELEQGR